MPSPSSSIETVYRTCPTCEAGCGLKLEVDRAARQVLSIKGDADDVRSHGYVCAKSQAFRYIFEDPERLRRPVKRVGDDWQEIGWEEALQEVATRLCEVRDKYGKDAIAMYYGNPNGHNFHTQIYTQLFITMLNTERFFSAGSVDQQPQNLVCELLFGNAWLFPVPDLERSDYFVCMGANPAVSQGSLLGAPDAISRIQGISERGGKTVVIDPRRTETAAACDEHIPVRPGSDALLLFAWVNELFACDRINLGALQNSIDGVEQLRDLAAPFTPESVAVATGVSAETLRRLVAEFCAAKSPVLYSRIGLCTQRFGTLASWLVYVINILTGRLDAPGGSMFARPATGQSESNGKVHSVEHGRFKSRASGFPEYMSMLPASLMAEELECKGNDAVHAMITVAGNPVLSVPNGRRVGTAMDELDFVVALDFYINETTSRADIILPSTSQLEHSNYEFLFSGFAQRNFSRYSPRVFEPEPDSKDQYELFLDIIARMNDMTADDLNAMMLDGLIGQITEGGEHLDAEQIKCQTEQYSDGERMLDILLRVGPYGDQFDDGAAGLNLQKVMQAPHGIDLGHLEPQLPGILRTEGQRVRLMHDIIVQDVPRLREALVTHDQQLLLIGRRHIRDMNSWLHNIHQYARGKNRCTLLVNPVDAKRLGLADGGRARISARVGEHEVEVCVSDEMMPGVVSLPHGFGHTHPGSRQSIATEEIPGVSANDLVDDGVLDLPSGTSVVNGVPVSVVALAP
jgi:anaerobic selenocysteine-containing dehydrogenase